MVVVCALALPVAAFWGAHPAAADTAVSYGITAIAGTDQAVPDMGALFGVGSIQNVASRTCPATTTCVAVGYGDTGVMEAWGDERYDGAVVSITNGTPGTVQMLPGTTQLTAVACSSATTCEAVGISHCGICDTTDGFAVTITNGIPGNPQPVLSAQDVGEVDLLDAVACSSPTTCFAVGTDPISGMSLAQGVVVPIINGTPGSLEDVPGSANLSAITCMSADTCSAVGTTISGQGVVVPISNGTPGSAQIASGTAQLSGVACQTATTCVAVGQNSPPPGVASKGVMVPIVNGTMGSAQIVPGTTTLNGVACPSSTLCQAEAPSGVVSVAIHTAVSLTFDNGAISQYTLGYQQALKPHGVKATFYINSGVTGGVNHLSWSQVSALARAGNEIGGKTVDGTTLTSLTTQQQISEICNDRQAIIAHGLTPGSFAYPGGAFNPSIETEVQNCGYATARTAGGISPTGPTYGESVPPKNPLALRAYAPTGQVTLASLEALVTGAALHGGAWVPIVIQKVCSQTLDPSNYATCTSSSGWVDFADLNAFLSWVQSTGQAGGAPAGTGVSPI
jgi:peptidoglycan/xylan/chitin deacetylase (PgdA/CDA1 family)